MQKAEFKAHLGVMDSGKSLLLMQQAYEQDQIGNRTIIAKPGVDTKAGEQIISRVGLKRNVDLLFSPDDNVRTRVLQHIGERAIHTHTSLYVDEVQFVEPEQIHHLRQLVTEDNISVNVFGLTTDFTGKMFPPVGAVFENADRIQQLVTACRGHENESGDVCGNSAIRNARLVNNEYVFSGETVAIDGEQNITYRSLCDFCYTAVKKAVARKSQQAGEAF